MRQDAGIDTDIDIGIGININLCIDICIDLCIEIDLLYNGFRAARSKTGSFSHEV